MRKARGELAFAIKSYNRLTIPILVTGKNFDRHNSIQITMLCSVDARHAARTEFVKNCVVADAQ